MDHKVKSGRPNATAPRLCFGSSLERTLFPYQFAPDRLGVQEPRREAPHVGPGCYNNHEFNTITYNLEKTPQSKRGYGLSARTAVRFPPCNKLGTPSPQQYQPDHSQSRVPSPGRTPFSSITPRFKSTVCAAAANPGPGTYAHDKETNHKVSWPMCFGRPDWSTLPQLERKALRVKLHSERELLKHRGRVAYLSLYY